LAEVTQVVSADAGHVFHNRLTHSIQVAQVGRRIAEKLKRESPEVEVDPDVVESACLAHDLGHPPFGHLGEEALNELALNNGLEGFEGNAQSFRIVTRLATGPGARGLNLTRATLNALLKYPWLHGQNPVKPDKFGAYGDDREIWEWARSLGPQTLVPCLEAQLMDWADDVTYSVHDLDDFYRAGVLPIDRLVNDRPERKRFFAAALEGTTLPTGMDEAMLRGEFESFLDILTLSKPFESCRSERQNVRNFTATLIRRFVEAIGLAGSPPTLTFERTSEAWIFMLKKLVWHYVIKRPALATQQHGQRKVIDGLFEAFYRAATEAPRLHLEIFPPSAREWLPEKPAVDKPGSARAIIDFIATLTEEQAVRTFHRLSGIALGASLVQPL